MLNLSRNLLFSALSLVCLIHPVTGQQNSGAGNLQYIDPRIGNVGQLLEPTRPTVQLPNQVMRMYPVRADYLSDQISSFPLLVVSHRLGEAFSFHPTTGPVTPDSWRKRMTFDHDLEITRPWYYSTYLVDDDITVEFVPGKKAGIYRFNFPGKSAKALLLDQYNNDNGSWNITDAGEVSGTETHSGSVKIFVYGKFSEPVKAGIVRDNQLVNEGAIQGKKVKAFVQFAPSAKGLIEFRYAVSFISAEQARKNFDSELNGQSFEQIKQAGEKTWAQTIGQIRVEGGTEAQKRSFYTALYRTYERMVDITEDNQYYSGYDQKIHRTDRPFYVDDWSWDTYLAHHPLRTLLHPAQEEDMLESYVKMYEQSGWVPTFPVLAGDHACMNGFHSTITFLDAYRKGLRKFNIPKAYEGAYKNATQATMLPWQNGPKGSLEDFYYKNGYFPALKKNEPETRKEVHSWEKRQAVAVTLGGAYDDWALGEFAKELGKTEDAKLFAARGLNYKNLWHKESGMFMPKDEQGNWVSIDPKFDGGMGGRDYYDENNGWTYLWQVQHDVPGLIGLMGGKAGFEGKLDQLFREGLGRSKYEFWAKFPDATGLVGQYSMGNEPSFHIPYLYNFTDSPWKTQKRIRFLLDVWFKDNVFGIPGDEDGGGMTAFVVFSSMGFYPVTPGLPLYTIGSPLFERVSINLANGKTFELTAKNASVENKYIQSAKSNGKPLNSPWFTHEQLVNGLKLELEMGPKPNKSWGTGK